MTSYVGSDRNLLLAIGDASYAPNVTRFGLQSAVGGLVKALHSSEAETPRGKLLEAFAHAETAVENAKRENQYTGPTGAALVVAIVHPDGVTVGRLGGGRVHLLVDGRLIALFEGPGLSFLGSGSGEPEICEHLTPMQPGDKVLILSEQAYSGTLGQLPELASKKAPQLAAVRILEAARRRGNRGSLANMVLQLTDPDRHQAVELGTGRPPLSNRLETPDRGRYRSAIYEPPPKGPVMGLLGLLLAAFVGGGVVAFIQVLGWGAAPPPEPADAESTAKVSRFDNNETEEDREDVVEWDALIEMDVAMEDQPTGDAEQIHAIFMQDSLKAAARSLRRYAKRRAARHDEDAFVHLDAWVRANRTPHTLAVLDRVLQTKLHFRLRRWVGKTLSSIALECVSRPDRGHDAGPTP